MFCPNCRAEYREGIRRCPECDLELVDTLPDPDAGAEPDAKLVKIFQSGDAAIIPVVESVLEGAGIEYLAKGEEVQDLFGLGRLGTNYSYIAGPVEFLVREKDAEAARGLLESVADAVPEDAEAPETD
jgi:hypothetical protein